MQRQFILVLVTFCRCLSSPRPLSHFYSIMPPGQHHTVYTPMASFCRGGHFFNFDTMHLTELSRFADVTHGKYITNDTHLGTLETLCRLVISLAILPASRSESRLRSSGFCWITNVSELYKRSLIALCGMVVYYTQYIAQGTALQTSDTFEMANLMLGICIALWGEP